LNTRRRNPFITLKLSAKDWKAKTLKFQAMENEEKKSLSARNFSTKVWNVERFFFSTFSNLQLNYGRLREKILSTFQTSVPKFGAPIAFYSTFQSSRPSFKLLRAKSS
jgi:valyl-tRNA synthetase